MKVESMRVVSGRLLVLVAEKPTRNLCQQVCGHVEL